MPDPIPCAYCGAVLPLAALIAIDKDGAYVYACPDCAVATGKEATSGRG